MKRKEIRIAGGLVVPLTRRQLDKLGVPCGAVVRVVILPSKRRAPCPTNNDGWAR